MYEPILPVFDILFTTTFISAITTVPKLMAASSGANSWTSNEEDILVAETPLIIDRRSNGAARNEQESILKQAKPLTNIVFYFMSIHFLLAFCEIILVAPLIKLFENSLCLSYFDFPVGGVEESLCKISEVQRPLATIRGWKSAFDTIPGNQSSIRELKL